MVNTIRLRITATRTQRRISGLSLESNLHKGHIRHRSRFFAIPCRENRHKPNHYEHTGGKHECSSPGHLPRHNERMPETHPCECREEVPGENADYGWLGSTRRYANKSCLPVGFGLPPLGSTV